MITIADIEKEAGKVNTTPTKPQKEAGNYSMGHISVKGMKIAIENPRGSRRYYGDDGDYVIMSNHYGYFNVTKGKDGDAVDVFLGPDIEDFDTVYCIDQNNEDGEFDETKVMLGFKSKEEAKEAYLRNYDSDWNGFRDITAVSLKVFKRWLYRGRKQRQPFADYVYIRKKKLDEMKKTVNLSESDIRMMIKNAVKRVIMENKLTRDDDFSYPDNSDDADLDLRYDEWRSANPSKEDMDELYGGMPENDEPDLHGDEGGYSLDADDEGDGSTKEYMAGVRYARNLIAKSRVPSGLLEQLDELDSKGIISPFQLGILDTLDEEL